MAVFDEALESAPEAAAPALRLRLFRFLLQRRRLAAAHEAAAAAQEAGQAGAELLSEWVASLLEAGEAEAAARAAERAVRDEPRAAGLWALRWRAAVAAGEGVAALLGQGLRSVPASEAAALWCAPQLVASICFLSLYEAAARGGGGKGRGLG